MNQLPRVVCFYCADQNTHRDRSRGLTHYTRELLIHLRDSGQVNLAALVSKSSFSVPEGIEKIVLPFASDSPPGRLLADHLHPLFASRTQAEIWHYPKGFLPLGPQVKAKRVGSIADVMLQFEADNYPRARSRFAYNYWLRMLRHSIPRLDLILTLTEFSKQDILRLSDRYRIKAPPIVVASLGVTVGVRAGPSSKGDYVVHLASHLPHKKSGWLLSEWAAWCRSRSDLPALLLIGTLDDEALGKLSELKNARLIGPLPRTELDNAMANARALILPSAIEGFGIPAVEAYHLGTPVAYVKGTAVEEVLGPGTPGGFAFESGSFRAAMTTVLELESSIVAAKSAELGERFTWEKTGRLTTEAYASLS